MGDELFDAKFRKQLKRLIADTSDFLKANWIVGVIITIGALAVLIVQQIILAVLNKSL